MKPPSITVVGSVNLDLVVRCETLPGAGETVLGGTFAKYPGGKGANQALAARRLGADVALIACVGTDAEAEQALALLTAADVDLSRCRRTPDHATGVAMISVQPGGDNQIVVAPGANAALAITDLPPRIDGALVGQLETPVPVLLEAAGRCQGPVCLNLAPSLAIPDALLARADILVVNETESRTYGLERLQKTGRHVAVTLGERGAVLFQGHDQIAEARPPRVDAFDATGAGDTFVAALACAWLEGQSPEHALAFACAAGAAATLKAGAQPSLPVRADVDSLIAGHAHA